MERKEALPLLLGSSSALLLLVAKEMVKARNEQKAPPVSVKYAVGPVDENTTDEFMVRCLVDNEDSKSHEVAIRIIDRDTKEILADSTPVTVPPMAEQPITLSIPAELNEEYHLEIDAYVDGKLLLTGNVDYKFKLG